MMGPYCRYCNQRCFIPLPAATPDHIREAYGTATIIAACLGGQVFERAKVGYSLADIRDAQAALAAATVILRDHQEKAAP